MTTLSPACVLLPISLKFLPPVTLVVCLHQLLRRSTMSSSPTARLTPKVRLACCDMCATVSTTTHSQLPLRTPSMTSLSCLPPTSALWLSLSTRASSRTRACMHAVTAYTVWYIARARVCRLTAAGFSVWIDADQPYDYSLEDVIGAMHASSVCVVCVSNEYANDDNCRMQFQVCLFVVCSSLT